MARFRWPQCPNCGSDLYPGRTCPCGRHTTEPPIEPAEPDDPDDVPNPLWPKA
jgi:hypothetical protein